MISEELLIAYSPSFARMDFAKFSPDHFLNLPCNAKQCQTNVNFILSISTLTITGQQALSLLSAMAEVTFEYKRHPVYAFRTHYAHHQHIFGKMSSFDTIHS